MCGVVQSHSPPRRKRLLKEKSSSVEQRQNEVFDFRSRASIWSLTGLCAVYILRDLMPSTKTLKGNCIYDVLHSPGKVLSILRAISSF